MPILKLDQIFIRLSTLRNNTVLFTIDTDSYRVVAPGTVSITVDFGMNKIKYKKHLIQKRK